MRRWPSSIRCRVAKIAGAAVVHADAVHRELSPSPVVDQVEGDDGEPALHQLGEMVEIEGRRADDDAADAEVEEVLGILALARGVAQAIAEHDLVAARLGRDLDGACHRAMRGIGDRGHEQADAPARTRSSAAAPPSSDDSRAARSPPRCGARSPAACGRGGRSADWRRC